MVAPHHKDIDRDDLESIQRHKTGVDCSRSKTMNRVISAELARRYAGTISSVAIDPGSIIDRDDPALADRWPKGYIGFLWRIMTAVAAKLPSVAGDPIADLVLSYPDRREINGALFKLGKQVTKPNKAMSDAASGQRLWHELVLMTGPTRE